MKEVVFHWIFQVNLLNMFFFCIFLQPVVMESWMVWKISSIVPVTWQSGSMDKDPNGRKLGTLPYNYGHSNPPLMMATSLVRPNSYGLIIATLQGSLPLSLRSEEINSDTHLFSIKWPFNVVIVFIILHNSALFNRKYLAQKKKLVIEK